MVSLRTSSGTWARIASVACCSHSPASGPRAWAPVRRSPSLTSGQVAVALGVGVGVRRGLRHVRQQRSAAEAVVGNADRRRLRVGVGHPRDRLVVGLARLPEDVGRDDLPLVLADVGQRPEPGDVADRPEVLRHAQVCVDRDAVGVRLDADGVEAEPLDPRPSPGGDQQPVAAQLPAVVEHHDVVLAVAPGRGHADGQRELDALTAQDLAQRLTERSPARGRARARPGR